MLRDHRSEAPADLCDRIVPGDRLEVSVTLGSYSPERLENSVWVVDTVEKPVDLGAQLAVGRGVFDDPTKRYGLAVLDGDLPHTGVGAVVMACTPNDLHLSGLSSGVVVRERVRNR